MLDLPTDVSNNYVVAGAAVAAALVVAGVASRPSKLDAIPTYGSSTWLGSWWASAKFLTSAAEVLIQGHDKVSPMLDYKSAPFKVATFFHWMVIVNSREHVDEVQRAPADVLSFMDASKDHLQVDYTMGPELHRNPYHVPLIRSQLTRNLGALYPEVRNEIGAAFEEALRLEGQAWKSVAALGVVQHVVCRVSNRAFVGLPLCRNPDWIDLNIRYTMDVIMGSMVISLFPRVLKRMAVRLLTTIEQGKRRGQKLLGPIIEQRREDPDSRPSDFLTWMIEAVEGPDATLECMTTRILATNVAAIHTASSSFGQALSYLAANPQYIQPLREEVDKVVENEGWSKASLGKMRKVDSFLKECQRLEGINCMSLQRKALKDFRFSDGTFVPKGTMLATVLQSAHHDPSVYVNPLAFEPFRFAHLSEGEGEGAKHQLVSTSVEYLPFGHGRQACPGRFFAALELKALLAHVVATYDVKLEDDATRPEAVRFSTSFLPDPDARVVFRRRA